mmetsp:Transcript_22603/g.27721  ORF Transcript_22603/g.27721 Transcript_22603/m.27721 type:complete len:180 (+) Transcript_22603:432-971(+)
MECDWIQLGSDIDGEGEDDYFGRSVSMSADGLIVAIGAGSNDGDGINRGHTRVYTWNSTMSDWIQLGSDINGESPGDWSGSSVSMSDNGQIVAIGAIYNSNGNGSFSGHVRVYTWISTINDWMLFGSDIDGESERGHSGYGVSMSGDGLTVAIGAELNNGNATYSGHVRIYSVPCSLST